MRNLSYKTVSKHSSVLSYACYANDFSNLYQGGSTMNSTMSPVIGHRGIASLAPENTLAGIQKAADAGMDWIEMDVTLLADGAAVMFHDAQLQRTTSSKGYIHKISTEEAQALDAGSWFSSEFSGEKVPLLEEALTLIKQTGMSLNLELKTNRCNPEQLANQSFQTIRNTQFPTEQLLISSFCHQSLTYYRQRCDHLLGCLFQRLPKNWQHQAESLKAVSIHVNAKTLNEQQARLIKAEGYELYCYTVNSSAQALILKQWGVDGFFSDKPQTLL